MIPLAMAAALALATAHATPSVAEIVARNRHAVGGRPVAERETWLARSAGLSGTLEVVRRGAERVSTLTLGPFRTERGVSGGRHWHQNENGETVIDAERAPPERAASENVSRVHEPVDAWLVTDTSASGRVSRSYYDARTFLLVRSEKAAGGHTTRTTYDDFRTDPSGRMRAAHFSGNDERPDTDFDFRLAHDEPLGAQDAGEFAIPPDRRTLVEFPAGKALVRLPARIAGGRIYVRLLVAGRALDFLLDSGSANITLDEGVAHELGLTAFGRTTQTVAGTFATERVIVPSVRIGPLSMHDVVMRTGPIAENEDPHTRVVGLLGFDFFESVGLQIDYGAGTVDAVPAGTLLPPAGAVPLELRLLGQVPVTSAAAGDAPPADFIVDTGTQFDAVLVRRFARVHPEPEPEPAFEPAVAYGRGVGGAVAYRPVALERLALGPLALTGLTAVLPLAENALGIDEQDGLLGAGILERFRVSFDYASNRLYLEPASAVPLGPARRKPRTRL